MTKKLEVQTKPLTMELAWKMANGLAKEFDVVIVDREATDKIGFVERMLALVLPESTKVVDALKEFSTSLGVYVLISDEARKTPTGVIRHAVHQIEHALQARDGRLETLWLYNTSPETRARLEAHAYAAELEVVHWVTGELPPKSELSWPLEGMYAIEGANLKLSEQILEARVTSFMTGELNSPVATSAIAWLKTLGLAQGHKEAPPAPSGATGA